MHFLIFLGSTRKSNPPKPQRLGAHVAKALALLVANDYPQHTCEIIDPLDYSFEGIFKPEFSYSEKDKPTTLKNLAYKIQKAHGYIMCSPEYNHSMSPALANMLNHFASSIFSYKPSAIVTYSAGQWGGARACVSMRAFLSELGCLPVSAMIHIPKAQDIFSESGQIIQPQNKTKWAQYMNRTILQLIWWAKASYKHKQIVDPHAIIETFNKDAAQRNAPS